MTNLSWAKSIHSFNPNLPILLVFNGIWAIAAEDLWECLENAIGAAGGASLKFELLQHFATF